MVYRALFYLFVICLLSTSQKLMAVDSIVVGNVRLQLLSDSLVRLEQRGTNGFEDRNTFHVINRDWPGAKFILRTNENTVEICGINYTVAIQNQASSLSDVEIKAADGRQLYRFDGLLTNSVWLPAPGDHPEIWSFADTPRIVPSKWGATPAPESARPAATSGWDLSNDAPDIYVFIPGGDYFRLRSDFLKLTGPTEMPPLYAFGAFDSRWHDYSEATALQQISDYRAHKIPLDVLVLDTGWRIGASVGYQPNTNLFPNMRRFLSEAHAKNVRVMFNDHPEPKYQEALDPSELKYRYNEVTSLLNEGLDVWWYDRNWMIALLTPMPGLRKEVWGMKLYHDMTQRDRADARQLIMANVDGIDNGICNRPMDMAAHRYPIQWTGDIKPGDDYLQRGVENAVRAGVLSLFPYMSEDLGGHVADPTTEGFIRWIEYGSLSPVYRPHCTYNHERMPWTFGPEAEEIARRFVDMRYRLLPVFYAAAHENYETGEPLLRRLDLDYPQFSEAASNDEYLLGKGILVAPVWQTAGKIIAQDWLKTPDGKPGLRAEYFANEDLSGTPIVTRIDKNINFDWSWTSPAEGISANYFSVRWTGIIELPTTITNDVILSAIADDGVRVWVDDEEIIDAWGPHDSVDTVASIKIAAGRPHKLRVEYQQITGSAIIRLFSKTDEAPARTLWLPPGSWINAWDGKTVKGPANIVNRTPLNEEPIFIKAGTIVPLAPEMQYTAEKPWDTILLEVYPNGEATMVKLYEDDTFSVDYKQGKFRKTAISASADSVRKSISVQIDAAAGNFNNAFAKRTWKLRLHLPADWPEKMVPKTVFIDGKSASGLVRKIIRTDTAMPFGDKVGAPDGDVFELTLPKISVSKNIKLMFYFTR